MNLNHEGIPWNAYTLAVTVAGGASDKMIYPRCITRAIAGLAIKERLEDIGKPAYEIVAQDCTKNISATYLIVTKDQNI